ncbi:MAG: helix-turn-helix transcriptional regulator [Niameybacter sp.]
MNEIFVSRLRALLYCHPVTGVKTTQQQLAQYLEIRPQTISLYVQGSTEPLASKLLNMARYFNVSADYLLGNDDLVQQLIDILEERKDVILTISNKR